MWRFGLCISEYTKNIPKTTIQIGTKPILSHIIDINLGMDLIYLALDIKNCLQLFNNGNLKSSYNDSRIISSFIIISL